MNNIKKLVIALVLAFTSSATFAQDGGAAAGAGAAAGGAGAAAVNTVIIVFGVGLAVAVAVAGDDSTGSTTAHSP